MSDSADRAAVRLSRLFLSVRDAVDLRLRDALTQEWNRPDSTPVSLSPEQTVVLAGHRASGKTRLLPILAGWLGREGIDLDAEIEKRAGRPIREWIAQDEPGFRQAERETFFSLPKGRVVAVGGGFLSLHSDLLRRCVTVLIPVTLQTYRERLLADTTRPRLRPKLPPEEEIAQVFLEREEAHAQVSTVSLVQLIRTRAHRPLTVVTLPGQMKGKAAIDFAIRCAEGGTDVLEIRTDLTGPNDVDAAALRSIRPLLFSERDAPIPEGWLQIASYVDRPLEGQDFSAGTGQLVISHHAEVPLTTEEMLRRWTARPLPEGCWVKHVEPLGEIATAARLSQGFYELAHVFGKEQVTVLAMGEKALAIRAALSQRNALDYVAVSEDFASAAGQRLLADAVRDRLAAPGRRRLGILGHPVLHSRSPRIHAQPFDRIDIPPDTELFDFLGVLHPYYAGFAVTSPFKRAAAAAFNTLLPAINTLVRRPHGYQAFNTDVAGASAVLDKLPGVVTVFGSGGATQALRMAADHLKRSLSVVKRESVGSAAYEGSCIWTWPAQIEAPQALRFEGASVAVIAYGPPAKTIAASIRARGGKPLLCGSLWLIAQAREQKKIWENAT